MCNCLAQAFSHAAPGTNWSTVFDTPNALQRSRTAQDELMITWVRFLRFDVHLHLCFTEHRFHKI